MRKLSNVCMGAVAFLMTGCATTPFSPPQGMLVSAYKAPLSVNFESANVSTKYGEVSAEHFNPWPCCFAPIPISWGGCDVDAAAKAGRLAKVAYADYEYLNVLWIYQRLTVRAYGE